MIQKATWIIPGILVTLLLGLLWAMPASAAKSGTVEFLDAQGGDEISYVSLNGPAADTGFWFQVADSDLDTITKSVGTNALEIVANGNAMNITSDGVVTAPGVEDWHDIQDMNRDGDIDNRDFTGAYLTTDPDTDEITAHKTGIDLNDCGDVSVDFDRSNGELTVKMLSSCRVDHDDDDQTTDVSVNALEYWIKEETILGARAGTDRTGTFEVNPVTAGVGEDVDAPGNGDGMPDSSLVDGDSALTWVQILESKISDLSTRAIVAADADTSSTTDEEEIEAQIAALINAYNKDDTTNKALNVTADATLGTSGDDDVVLSIEITIDNTDAGTEEDPIDENTVCVGNIRNEEELEENGSLACIDTTYYDASAVVVEVKYNGSAATIYDVDDNRIGDEDDLGRVTVDSSGATSAISVLLQETGAATGIYGANVKICPAGVGDCGTAASQDDETSDTGVGMIMLPVEAAGDTITVSYRDGSPRGTRRATIALDPSGPSFGSMSPDSGTAGREDEPTVSFEAVDGESGLTDDEDVEDSIYVVAGLYDIDEKESSDSVVYIRDDLDADEVTNGFSASVTIDEGDKNGNGNNDRNDRLDAGDKEEYEIRWWAVAVDMAGNVGVSDQDGDTKCDSDVLNKLAVLSGFDAARDKGQANAIIRALEGTIEPKDGDTAAIGCDPSVIRVDSAKPELSLAETGYYLDGDDEKAGSSTSVVARFSEPLDCDTVSADDFEVDGSAPNAATCDGMNVYLDVDELDSNETPDVSVADGAVTDSAGNAIGADEEVESKDGIPAGISVTVEGTASGDRPVTTKTITVTVTSDERMKGRPTVDIRKVGDDYTLGATSLGGEATSTGTENEWSMEKNLTGAGLYNVYVTAEDRASSGLSMAGLRPAVTEDHDDNTATAEKPVVPAEFKLSADDLKSDKIILFEVDNAISDPVFTPENDGSTDNASIFIRVNFEDEGNEYGLGLDEGEADDKTDDTKPVTDDPTEVKTDFDSHSTVTLVSATFNGEDVMEEIISRDNILFVYRHGNLTDGDHKLEIEVEDAAGNERELSLEFAKTPRQPYELHVNPGPNLVSFPGNPVDGDINAVFGGEGNEDVLSVVTFDNATSLWMTATRGADGMFMGDLTTIDAMHGYWVVSDGVLTLEVMLSGSANITTTPPHIPVQKGWNLVPVADTQQRKAGTGIDTDEYFANIDAEVVYGWKWDESRLDRLSIATATEPDEQDQVEVGAAYWVYANEAGIIIP